MNNICIYLRYTNVDFFFAAVGSQNKHQTYLEKKGNDFFYNIYLVNSLKKDS